MSRHLFVPVSIINNIQCPCPILHFKSPISMSQVQCPMTTSSVKCLMPDGSCLNVQFPIYNFWCLMFNVQCPKSNVQCPMTEVECLMSDVRCQMSNVQCRTPSSPLSNAQYPCPMFYVLFQKFSNVPCLMPNLLWPISNIQLQLPSFVLHSHVSWHRKHTIIESMPTVSGSSRSTL